MGIHPFEPESWYEGYPLLTVLSIESRIPADSSSVGETAPNHCRVDTGR
jgi:hypothetical protein